MGVLFFPKRVIPGLCTAGPAHLERKKRTSTFSKKKQKKAKKRTSTFSS